MEDAVVSMASASVPNRYGRVPQDCFACGQGSHGAWVAVADGIGGGDLGAEAASVAVAVARRELADAPLDEAALAGAFERAHVAVRAMFASGARGGTTLTLAAVTPGRIMLAAVGDSRAWLLRDGDGDAQPASPIPAPGPLPEWVGQSGPIDPWIGTLPVADGTMLIVGTDGADPGAARGLTRLDPAAAVRAVLRTGRDDDDATVVAAVLVPIGAPGAPKRSPARSPASAAGDDPCRTRELPVLGDDGTPGHDAAVPVVGANPAQGPSAAREGR